MISRTRHVSREAERERLPIGRLRIAAIDTAISEQLVEEGFNAVFTVELE